MPSAIPYCSFALWHHYFAIFDGTPSQFQGTRQRILCIPPPSHPLGLMSPRGGRTHRVLTVQSSCAACQAFRQVVSFLGKSPMIAERRERPCNRSPIKGAASHWFPEASTAGNASERDMQSITAE